MNHTKESVEAMANLLCKSPAVSGFTKSFISVRVPEVAGIVTMLCDLQARIEELESAISRLIQADEDQSLDSEDIEFAKKVVGASSAPPTSEVTP